MRHDHVINVVEGCQIFDVSCSIFYCLFSCMYYTRDYDRLQLDHEDLGNQLVDCSTEIAIRQNQICETVKAATLGRSINEDIRRAYLASTMIQKSSRIL
jgi:hypothetical protein